MKKEGRVTLLSVVLMLFILGISTLTALYSKGMLDFSNKGTIIGILIGLAVILVLICWCAISLRISIKGYRPEKKMARLQKKKATSLKSICYYMTENKWKTHAYALMIGIAFYLFNFSPVVRNFSRLPATLYIIVHMLLANLLVVIYYRENGQKKLIENTSWRLNMPKDILLEKLETSLKKGLLFKEKHLIMTEDFIISSQTAVPRNYIESLNLYEPKDTYDVFSIFNGLCKLKLTCKMTTGNSVTLAVGGDEEEIAHIKRFFTYYSGINAEMREQYKVL